MPCSCRTNCLSNKNRNVCQCRTENLKCSSLCTCGEKLECCNGKIDVCVGGSGMGNEPPRKRIRIGRPKIKNSKIPHHAAASRPKQYDNEVPQSNNVEEASLIPNDPTPSIVAKEQSETHNRVDLKNLTAAQLRILIEKIQDDNPNIRIMKYLETSEDLEEPWEKIVNQLSADDIEPPQPNPIPNVDPPPPNPDEGNDAPWCKCGNCQEMPTPEERKCCSRRRNTGCMTDSPDLENLILNRGVLDIQMEMRQNLVHLLQEDGDVNRKYRHAAYRQYIYWQWGKLGQGNRRVIPSCVVWKIRVRYPNPNGIYTGYKQNRYL